MGLEILFPLTILLMMLAFLISEQLKQKPTQTVLGKIPANMREKVKKKKKEENPLDNLLFVDDKGKITKLENNKEVVVRDNEHNEHNEDNGEEIGAENESEEGEMLAW